ncbi:MAG: Sak single strand annealing protein [Candidatus Thorarchaeota archaeon]
MFETLNAINVNGRTETKNGLTYLSWAWAWATAKENYPEATYTIYEDADGVFYHRDHNSAWVKTGVTIEGIEHIEYLPVMDFRNNSIDLVKIKSTDVNKAIQRSLTKALARHGLGLYVYAGEDLPSSEKEQPKVESKKTTTVEVKGIPDDKMMDMLKYVAENKELGLKQLVANIEQKYHVTKTQEKEIAKVLKSK